jgi:hypothetical protein
MKLLIESIQNMNAAFPSPFSLTKSPGNPCRESPVELSGDSGTPRWSWEGIRGLPGELVKIIGDSPGIPRWSWWVLSAPLQEVTLRIL